jgi:hypothetical protein
MTLILNGTNGLSDVDGDASTPAVRGTDANSGIFFGADQVGVSTNGVERVEFGNSETVFNDGGADVDFRVEGDTNANLIVADAGADKVGIGTNTFNTNGGVLQVSNGISFPATQSALSDANTLDDYEEGTFTPSLTFGGGTTGITYSGGRTGTYVKVGKMVFCSCRMVLSAKGASTGDALITGLPFTSQSANDFTSGGIFCAWNDVTFTGQMFINLGDNQSEIGLFNMATSGTRTALTHANFSDTSRFSWVVVYLVA